MADIRAVAQRLGYAPNIAARALRRGRFDCVALLSSSRLNHSFLPEPLLSGIHDGLTRHRVRLTFARADDDLLTDASRLKARLQHVGADGLLLDYTDHIPFGLADQLAGLRLPLVWINRDVASDGVRVDDRAGVRAIAESLIARGRRRIAYIDFSHRPDDQEAHYSARERRAGWWQTTSAAGVAGPVFQAAVPATERLAAAQSWLRSLDAQPDALIGYCTEHLEILLSAAHREGLVAPAIADCGAVDQAPALLGAAYLWARLPLAEVAAAAVDLLLRKVADPGMPVATLVLPPSLVPAA